MTERIILELSPGWFVLADPHQWMLATGPGRPQDAPNKAAGARYRPVSYIGGQKAVLLRCAREKSAPVTPEAMRIIDTWPDRFLDWRDQQDRRAAA